MTRANKGPSPYGYRRGAAARYEIHEREADTVRSVFTLYAFSTRPSYGLGGLLDLLMRHGVRTRRGRVFSKAALHYVLTNRFYLGGEDHPPITAPIVFNRVQKKLVSRRNKNKVTA